MARFSYVSYEAAPAFEEFAVHQAPLMGEYLLYFTIHSETLPFPEDYEAVDLPANWKEGGRAPAYQKLSAIHHHIRQGDTYQVSTVSFLEAKSDPFAIYNRIGG